MNAAAVLTYAVFSFALYARAQGDTVKLPAESFSHSCGRLEYAAAPSTARKPLSGVRVDLFESEAGVPCCSGLRMVESVITNSRGTFRFKRPNAGRYFVVAHYLGGNSNLEVVVKEKEKNVLQCWQQQLVIDPNGRMQMYRTIVFDYGHN